MFHTLRNWIALAVLSFLLVAASAQQGDGPAWWVWLVAISVLLLLVFIIVVALAWRDTGRPGNDK